MSHTLRIETGYADGDTTTWEYDQPGDARTAHTRLYRQWRDQRARFTRDRDAMTVRREYDHPELGRYVQTVTHIPQETP